MIPVHANTLPIIGINDTIYIIKNIILEPDSGNASNREVKTGI
jgi:hypothetical protein